MTTETPGEFDWEKAKPRERDAWLAENLFQRHVTWVAGPGNHLSPYWMTPHGSHLVPLYTYELYLAFEVQAKAALLHGWSRYAQTLWRLMFVTDDFSWEKVWGVANASAEQRCRAAYLVLTAAR